jgi:hypothetical protein
MRPRFVLKKSLHVVRENFLNVLLAKLESTTASLIWINDGISDPRASLTKGSLDIRSARMVRCGI